MNKDNELRIAFLLKQLHRLEQTMTTIIELRNYDVDPDEAIKFDEAMSLVIGLIAKKSKQIIEYTILN